VLRRGGRGEGLMFGGPLNVLAGGKGGRGEGGKGGRRKGVLSYYDLEMISFYLDEFGTGSFGAPPGPIRPYPSYFLPANCTQAWQGKIELTPLSTGIAHLQPPSFLSTSSSLRVLNTCSITPTTSAALNLCISFRTFLPSSMPFSPIVRATWITGTSNSYSPNQLDHGDNQLGIRVGYVNTPLAVLHHVYFGVLEWPLFPCLGELGACRIAEATCCTAVEGYVDWEAAEEEGEGLAHCLA